MVRTGVGGSARIATLVSGACCVVAEVCFDIIEPVDGTCGGALGRPVGSGTRLQPASDVARPDGRDRRVL